MNKINVQVRAVDDGNYSHRP